MGLTTAILTTVGTTTVLAEEVETVEVVTEKATTNETVIESAREKLFEKQEEVDTQTIVANQTTKETERIGNEKDAKAVEVADAKTELAGKEGTVTEKEEKVAELEALKDNATIEKPKVEKGIADTNQEISTKENDVNGKVIEVDGIKQQVTAQEGVVASETSKLEAITEEKEKLVNANIELSNALNQQDSANKEVETQTSNVANAEQTKSELEQEKTSILEANADKQADIERLESEISELNTQVEEKQPSVDSAKKELDEIDAKIAQFSVPTLLFNERYIQMVTEGSGLHLEEMSTNGMEIYKLLQSEKYWTKALEAFDNEVRYNPTQLPEELRQKMAFFAQYTMSDIQKAYKEKLLKVRPNDIKSGATGSWVMTKEATEAARIVAEYSTNDEQYDWAVEGHNDRALAHRTKVMGNTYSKIENLGIGRINPIQLRDGMTERDLMRGMLEAIVGMLFRDADSDWGHITVMNLPVRENSSLGVGVSMNYSKTKGQWNVLYHFIATDSTLKRDGSLDTDMFTFLEQPTVESLTNSKAELQSTYNTLNSELTEIKNNLETKTTELNTLTEGIIGLEDVNARIERNETTLANFRQALAMAQSNKAVADDLVAKATEKSTKYNELVTQESNQRAVVEREIAVLNDLKGQLVTKEQELSTLRNELNELETKVLTLTERLNTLNNIDDLLSEAKSELALATSERDVLKQTIATLELELADLVTSYNEAKVLSDAEQAKLTELREELTFLKEELGLIEMALAPVFEEEKPAFVGVIEEDGKKWEVKADGTIVEIKEEENKKPIETVGGAIKPITNAVNEKELPQTGDVQSGLEMLTLSSLTVAVLLAQSGYRSRKYRRNNI